MKRNWMPGTKANCRGHKHRLFDEAARLEIGFCLGYSELAF